MLYKNPDLALSGTGIYMQQAGKRLSRVEVEVEAGWEGGRVVTGTLCCRLRNAHTCQSSC